MFYIYINLYIHVYMYVYVRIGYKSHRIIRRQQRLLDLVGEVDTLTGRAACRLREQYGSFSSIQLAPSVAECDANPGLGRTNWLHLDEQSPCVLYGAC